MRRFGRVLTPFRTPARPPAPTTLVPLAPPPTVVVEAEARGYNKGYADGQRELIAKLDAKCLGRTPEQSLRVVGNNGVPLTYIGRSYTTHVAGDLAGMADVIEEARNGLG